MNTFASGVHPPVYNICIVLPKRKYNQILNVFFTVIFKDVLYGIDIIVQFYHR